MRMSRPNLFKWAALVCVVLLPWTGVAADKPILPQGDGHCGMAQCDCSCCPPAGPSPQCGQRMSGCGCVGLLALVLDVQVLQVFGVSSILPALKDPVRRLFAAFIFHPPKVSRTFSS